VPVEVEPKPHEGVLTPRAELQMYVLVNGMVEWLFLNAKVQRGKGTERKAISLRLCSFASLR